jgi:DNA-binding NarL/FixJ family response regulator
VLDGGAPISAAVAGHLLRKVRHAAKVPVAEDAPEPATSLSEREVQVLKCLARGQSYKEVARDMGLSPYTVGDHVKRIYQKLAVGSRGEAVYEAIKGGLIDLSD